MFVTIYFPMVDFRRLYLSPDKLVLSPSWPDFFEHRRQFQKNLGGIRRRPLGPLSGWVDEDMICEVKRGFSIENFKKANIQKRFFFDGSYSGYFSISFSGLESTEFFFSHSPDSISDALSNLSELTVRSPHFATTKKLAEAAELFEAIYSSGTRKGTFSEVDPTNANQLVSVGKPTFVVEESRNRILDIGADLEDETLATSPYRLTKSNIGGFDKAALLLLLKKSRDDDLAVRQARMVVSRLFCELFLLEKLIEFLQSSKSLEIPANKKDEFCYRISNCISRLNGSERPLKKSKEFYKKLGELFFSGIDISKVDRLCSRTESLGFRRNLKHQMLEAHIWANREDIDNIEIIKEKVMTKYENKGQAGAFGENAQNQGGTFTQNIQADTAGIDLQELKSELETLRAELVKNGTLDDLSAAGKIAEAEKQLKEDDTNGAFEALASAGKWALETATKIGIPVAIAALKRASGL